MENGKDSRTTADQYNSKNSKGETINKEPLHAYTTKNAIDDKSVLGFQVEYHCLLYDGIIIRSQHKYLAP
jgi:type I restriction enzyme R subunit